MRKVQKDGASESAPSVERNIRLLASMILSENKFITPK